MEKIFTSSLYIFILEIIIIFGMISIDYFLVISLRELLNKAVFKKYRINFLNGIWFLLIFSNIILLNRFVVTINEKGFLIDNHFFLYIIMLFYFLYMLKSKIVIYLSTLFSLYICYRGINASEINWGLGLFLAILAISFIYVSAFLINKNREQWIDQFIKYAFSLLVFGGSFGIIKVLSYSGNIHFKIHFFEYYLYQLFFGMLIIHLLNLLVRDQIVRLTTLNKQVFKDELTTINNRLSFNRSIEEAFNSMIKYKLPLTLVICDIDNFKRFNDTYGHSVGDEVLKYTAQLIKKNLDIMGTHGQIFRIGGEEFGIIFRNQTSEVSNQIMIEICKNLKENKVIYGDKKLGVTISVGISQQRVTDTKVSQLYQRVDKYLYQSKENGRHAVTLEGKTPIVY